jgi:type I restriction enzyme R subunit
MGNEELRVIAQELVTAVQNTSSVDWWRKQNVRTKMRITIKRILKKHGFPPDLQAESVKKVLQQAEVLAKAFS